MKCPVCNVNLIMSDRQGVEIDYCPQCRGVWLDRGELDKIIDRSATWSNRNDDDDYRKREEPYKRGDDDYRRKRRKSFLGELFDFD